MQLPLVGGRCRISSPFTLAAVSMMLVGLFAALVPASRASRVDPVTALRSEA